MDDQLITIEESTALDIFTDQSETSLLNQAIAKVREEVEAFKGDVSTEKGRKEIASFAYKVTKTKGYIEGFGKDLARKQKAIPKAIDAVRNHVKTSLDELRDQVRAPLKKWEDAKIQRDDEMKAALATLQAFANTSENGRQLSGDDIDAKLADLDNIACDASWGEFQGQAMDIKEAAMNSLQVALGVQRQNEKDQAELRRLREKSEQVEQERKRQEQEAHDQKVAKEAREQAERDAEARRVKEQQDRERAEKQAAADLIAERQRREEAEAQAERDRIQSIENARIEKERSDDAARERERAAVLAERERIDADALAEKQEADRKAADVDNRRNVNRSVVSALMLNLGVDEEFAMSMVRVIVKGSIPHTSINYGGRY